MAVELTAVQFIPTKIFVKDFGPIREAVVYLGKATILMGPNNTGKTYFTLLVPVLYELVEAWRFMREVLAPPKYTLEDFELRLNKILEGALYGFYFVEEPVELVRRGSEKAEIKFELAPKDGQSDNIELEVQISKSGAINSKLHGFDELFESSKAPAIEPVVYIPAERAGMLRTFRQLQLMNIQLMSKKIRLSGVGRLFLDRLLDVEKFTIKEREKAYVAPALKLLEEEVLGGRLEMDRDFSVTYHEIGAKKPIKLINASAMVSELSALYLLSGTLKEGWWLVVEEPEAHVHPRGQMGLARFMAMLARLGVNVMATTHSDLIALKLVQMVGLAGLSPEERERLGYRGDEYLTKEELALYSFEPTKDGSVARKVEVSETGEVSELPTYSNVLEELYIEAVRILELHGKIHGKAAGCSPATSGETGTETSEVR